MDKTEFYTNIYIDDPSEFKYFENLDALLEEEEEIEDYLISELLTELDKEVFAELMDVYFDKFLEELPDSYGDLYLAVETIKRVMCGRLSLDMTAEDCREYADLIDKFRHWYTIDTLAYDALKEQDVSVKSARYDILIARFTEEPCKFDFRDALSFDAGGYDVRVADMLAAVDEMEDPVPIDDEEKN